MAFRGVMMGRLAATVLFVLLVAVPAALASEGGAAAAPAATVSSADRAAALARAYPMEAALLLVIIIYLLSVVAGRKENLQHATEWSKAFAEPDTGMLSQQFSHHGYVGLDSKDADSFYWREGPATFKFWGSGRRFCTGALFTINTPPRQDMVRRLLPGASDGRVEVDVWMAEGAMAPMVLAIAAPKALRQLAKSNVDVKDFTKRVEVTRDRLPQWPVGGGSGGKELAVMAESGGIFYDLFADARIQQLIGREPAVQKLIRSIVFTSEGGLGHPKAKLAFSFALPPPGAMEELRPCLTLVFLLMDLVGGYKLGSDAAAKAAALRQRVEASRAEQREKDEAGGSGSAADRQAAAQARRLEKLAEEREKARRQGPKALEKFEEKLRKQQLKKQMKRHTIKMG